MSCRSILRRLWRRVLSCRRVGSDLEMPEVAIGTTPPQAVLTRSRTDLMPKVNVRLVRGVHESEVYRTAAQMTTAHRPRHDGPRTISPLCKKESLPFECPQALDYADPVARFGDVGDKPEDSPCQFVSDSPALHHVAD